MKEWKTVQLKRAQRVLHSYLERSSISSESLELVSHLTEVVLELVLLPVPRINR